MGGELPACRCSQRTARIRPEHAPTAAQDAACTSRHEQHLGSAAQAFRGRRLDLQSARNQEHPEARFRRSHSSLLSPELPEEGGGERLGASRVSYDSTTRRQTHQKWRAA